MNRNRQFRDCAVCNMENDCAQCCCCFYMRKRKSQSTIGCRCGQWYTFIKIHLIAYIIVHRRCIFKHHNSVLKMCVYNYSNRPSSIICIHVRCDIRALPTIAATCSSSAIHHIYYPSKIAVHLQSRTSCFMLANGMNESLRSVYPSVCRHCMISSVELQFTLHAETRFAIHSHKHTTNDWPSILVRYAVLFGRFRAQSITKLLYVFFSIWFFQRSLEVSMCFFQCKR